MMLDALKRRHNVTANIPEDYVICYIFRQQSRTSRKRLWEVAAYESLNHIDHILSKFCLISIW